MNKFFSTNKVTVNATTSATANFPSAMVIFEAVTINPNDFVDFTINCSFIPDTSERYKPHVELIYMPDDGEALSLTVKQCFNGVLEIRVYNPTGYTASADKAFWFNLDNFQM